MQSIVMLTVLASFPEKTKNWQKLFISFCVGLAETDHFSPSFLHHTSISMFHEDNLINYFTNVTGKVP
jgi:hypothetical protein